MINNWDLIGTTAKVEVARAGVVLYTYTVRGTRLDGYGREMTFGVDSEGKERTSFCSETKYSNETNEDTI